MHGIHEDLCTLGIISEHIQTGTGRRQQHRVTRLRLIGQPACRGRQISEAFYRKRRRQHCSDCRRIFADECHGTTGTFDHRRQRREVLTLALAAQQQCQLAVRVSRVLETIDRRQGGTDVGRLGIIDVTHIIHCRHQRHAMRQTAEALHARQQIRDRLTGRQRMTG